MTMTLFGVALLLLAVTVAAMGWQVAPNLIGVAICSGCAIFLLALSFEFL